LPGLLFVVLILVGRMVVFLLELLLETLRVNSFSAFIGFAGLDIARLPADRAGHSK
jgi:hypothetical protein